jgi:hypothetical protein
MYVFGGFDSKHSYVEDWGEIICSCEYMGEWGCNCPQPDNDVYDDLWEFNFETGAWKPIPRKSLSSAWPYARINHIAATNGMSDPFYPKFHQALTCTFMEVTN